MPITKKVKPVAKEGLTNYTVIVEELDGGREFTVYIAVSDIDNKDEFENEVVDQVSVNDVNQEWTMADLKVKHVFKGTHAALDMSAHSLEALIRKWTHGGKIARKLQAGPDYLLIMCLTGGGVDCLRFEFYDGWTVSRDHSGVDWCDAYDWMVESVADFNGVTINYDKCIADLC